MPLSALVKTLIASFAASGFLQDVVVAKAHPPVGVYFSPFQSFPTGYGAIPKLKSG